MRIVAVNDRGTFKFRTWDAYREWARHAGHHRVWRLELA